MKRGFEKNLPQPSEAELKRLMQKGETQQLLALLNADGGAAMQQAAKAAQRGDYEAVREILAPKLQNAQAEQLLKKLGGNGSGG